MKILIQGDAILPPSVLQRVLQEELKKVVKELEFRKVEVDLSEEPEPIPEPIKEYRGSPKNLIEKIEDVEILVVHIAPVTDDVLRAGKNLRLVGCCRAGPVNVNVEAATKRGIPVLNTPGRNTDAVADFTFGLILAIARHIPQANTFLKEGKWKYGGEVPFEKYKGYDMLGKTIGIIGFGKVGTRAASIAKGFKMKVLVYDPYVPKERIAELDGKPVNLETLMRESDFVTLHTRLPSGAKPVVGAKELALMKRTAYLINTARGFNLDERALYHALRDRKIAGAALDVYEKEPLEMDNPLLKLENVLLTPHIAGSFHELPLRTSQIMARDIRRFLSGEKPLNIVNSSVLKL